jgi:hypothetical protein
MFAVEFVIEHQTNPDGSLTVTETVKVRRTYPQNWPAYNAAQTNEGDKFQVLLRDLCCRAVPEPLTRFFGQDRGCTKGPALRPA